MTSLIVRSINMKRESFCQQCRKSIKTNDTSILFRFEYKGIRVGIRTCKACGVNHLCELRDQINKLLREI